MIKAILFDMDGTLVDSEKYYTDGTYNWMQRYGYNKPKETIYPIIGTSMAVTYDIIYKLLENKLSLEEVINNNDHYFMVEDIIDYRTYVFDEVVEVLKDLRAKGYKMAICSSSFKEDILRFLDENELTTLFDVVLSSHECLHAKPSPEIYLRALNLLGLNKDEVFVVEDSSSGIKSAKAAGLYTVARKDNRFNIDQSEADCYVDDLRGIYKIIGEIDNE